LEYATKFINVITFIHVIYEVVDMVSLTLSVSSDLKAKMDNFPELNWSEVARSAIEKKIVLLQKLEEFTSESEATDKDIMSLSKKVKSGIARRLAVKRHGRSG
jgi:hypothetical protein